MNKCELRQLISECVNEVKSEQNDFRILKESFDLDVRRLEEHRRNSKSLLTEGIMTEDEIDEGFFDTVKHFASGAAKDIKDKWAVAKEKGNQSEMQRLQKQMDDLKKKSAGNKSTQQQDKPVSGSNVKGKPIKGGKPVAGGKTVKGGKVAPVAKTKPINKSASKAIAKKTVDTVMKQIQKNDPKQFAVLQNLAKTNPKKIAALINNPKIQQEKNKIQAAVAKTQPDDPKQPGFLGKTWAWAKKNPVKAVAGLGLIAATGGVAAIGAGGLGALVTGALLAGAKGSAIGGAIGGVTKGATAIAGDLKAGNKVNWKNAGKEAWTGVKKGAKAGFIGGALGNVAGKAVAGAQQIHHDSGTPDVSHASNTPPPNTVAKPTVAAATAQQPSAGFDKHINDPVQAQPETGFNKGMGNQQNATIDQSHGQQPVAAAQQSPVSQQPMSVNDKIAAGNKISPEDSAAADAEIAKNGSPTGNASAAKFNNTHQQPAVASVTPTTPVAPTVQNTQQSVAGSHDPVTGAPTKLKGMSNDEWNEPDTSKGETVDAEGTKTNMNGTDYTVKNGRYVDINGNIPDKNTMDDINSIDNSGKQMSTQQSTTTQQTTGGKATTHESPVSQPDVPKPRAPVAPAAPTPTAPAAPVAPAHEPDVSKGEALEREGTKVNLGGKQFTVKDGHYIDAKGNPPDQASLDSMKDMQDMKHERDSMAAKKAAAGGSTGGLKPRNVGGVAAGPATTSGVQGDTGMGDVDKPETAPVAAQAAPTQQPPAAPTAPVQPPTAPLGSSIKDADPTGKLDIMRGETMKPIGSTMKIGGTQYTVDANHKLVDAGGNIPPTGMLNNIKQMQLAGKK